MGAIKPWGYFRVYPSLGCPENLFVSAVLSGQCLGAFLKAQLTAGFRLKDGGSVEEQLCE